MTFDERFHIKIVKLKTYLQNLDGTKKEAL